MKFGYFVGCETVESENALLFSFSIRSSKFESNGTFDMPQLVTLVVTVVLIRLKRSFWFHLNTDRMQCVSS
jgi:hypothetical protein